MFEMESDGMRKKETVFKIRLTCFAGGQAP